MKGKRSKSSENDIPEEIYLKVGMGARMFLDLPTLPKWEARKWVKLGTGIPGNDGLCSQRYSSQN